MSLPDRYLVPATPSAGEFRDRGSKFVAALYPVRTESEALEAVQTERQVHAKCNHHCYAYRLGPGEDRWRANDDGEPSGTAGLPILGQLDKAELSDAVVVVSRYFGGTKLGTSGLIVAYREAARLAVEAASATQRVLTDTVVLRFGYALMTPVMGALDRLGLEMADQVFGTTATVTMHIPRSDTTTTLRDLKAAVSGRYPEEIDEDRAVDGLNIAVHPTT